MRRTITLACVVLAGLALSARTVTGQGFPEDLMQLKPVFQGGEERAAQEPFVGIHTEEGIIQGLFPLRQTGVSTEPVRQAANAFLATLSPIQLMRTQFHAQDSEWRHWLNVDNGIYSRRGTPLAEMDPAQRDAAMALLSSSLSARGLEQSLAIMLTDQALQELNPQMASFLNPGLYYFTIMGTPSATEPWGWQFEGHHLVINYFVLGDQVVMTPTFWGGEPVLSRHGSTAGNAVLQDQQDRGLALMQSLDGNQRAAATLAASKSASSMVAGAFQDNLQLDYAGISGAQMAADQRDGLAALIESYVGMMDDGHAAIRMEEVLAHLDETHFAWVGSADEDAAFYYRVHSPVILIEFDHQAPINTRMINAPGIPTRDHIHTIVRTPNGNDYGSDLLAQHLAQAHQ